MKASYCLLWVGFAILVLVSGCASDTSEKQRRGGVAISFDDRFLSDWEALRPLLSRYGARVTFYLTCDTLRAEEIAILKQLQKDGHEIGFHGTIHGNARLMIRESGVEGFLQREIIPGMNYLRKLGFSPTSYAHPGGNNTAKGDSALLAYGFVNLRDVAKAERYYRGVRLYHVPPAYMPQVYYRFGKGQRRLKALQIDMETRINRDEMKEALYKAGNDGTVLMLFGHQPLPENPPAGAYGFDVRFLEMILKESKEAGLAFYTMSELRPE